ncbi:hypothetical protein FYM13_14110 [Staphylococcus aureus]|uniref:Uncharacterized protein n=1 Tax=Staphylococcus aureus TaxID=1280 RepID=A0A380E1G2_STAAU|nr:hypothetical protein [Staphylococcus aureus]MBH4538838.1 hypothetical protein [Staphylococcus aureus]MBH4540602.1 hypothetical protein [Staphylococcus aureus]MBH4547367.1 hypothetical protein [Staphylococcus aureus]MBH4550616.1 hypothetical protein [Staphylococcus aureus]MBH4553161.1 hypothetical protein [Staphylococcus aureus]
MVFNDWEIKVIYSGEHEVVTNEKCLFVIDEFYDVAIAIYYLDGKLKVGHVNYGSDFTIDVENKVFELNIHNPNVDEH